MKVKSRKATSRLVRGVKVHEAHVRKPGSALGIVIDEWNELQPVRRNGRIYLEPVTHDD